MTVMNTPVCDFNAKAIPFSLQGVDGQMWDLAKSRGANGLLLMFICNHCPYVRAILPRLVSDVKKLQAQGVGCVAIMSNDTAAYPEDGYANMQKVANKHNFSFPYLLDESQATAQAYQAVCTPDFFGYNKELKLQYRGRFDSAGINSPDNNTVKELLNAMLQIATSGSGPQQQHPSVGCSIKWK